MIYHKLVDKFEKYENIIKEFVKFMDDCSNFPDTTEELNKLYFLKVEMEKLLEKDNDPI